LPKKVGEGLWAGKRLSITVELPKNSAQKGKVTGGRSVDSLYQRWGKVLRKRGSLQKKGDEN